MANVHDYLRWRGDLSFSERPFNDADNVVLSALSYVDFSGVVPGEGSDGSVRLATAYDRLAARRGGDVSSAIKALVKIDAPFVELAASSRRFGDARLRAYVDTVDESRALQFSAVQVDLPDAAGSYIAFRGTDSTLVGWREDFMSSFCVTEAQHEAQRYLERAFARLADSDAPIRVGGHSKGGNLAEYAAACCPAELRDRIACVYSNDGPGLAPEVIAVDSRAILGGRFRHIVPAYSVVGLLFAKKGEPRSIVRSKAVGIGQHDPTTWQMTPDGVLPAEGFQRECVLLAEAIARWTKGVPLDERRRVVDEVFDALEAGGATRFDEIASSPEQLQKVLRALGATDDRTRELAIALVDATFGSSMGAMRKSTREVVEAWLRGTRSLADGAARTIQNSRGDIRVPLRALRPSRRR